MSSGIVPVDSALIALLSIADMQRVVERRYCINYCMSRKKQACNAKKWDESDKQKNVFNEDCKDF